MGQESTHLKQWKYRRQKSEFLHQTLMLCYPGTVIYVTNSKRGKQSCAIADPNSPWLLVWFTYLERVRTETVWGLQLALAGVWVVHLAWRGWGICGAEAEKPRLTNRGRLRQPCLCFYAWPHSTWRWKRAMAAEIERQRGKRIVVRWGKVKKQGLPVQSWALSVSRSQKQFDFTAPKRSKHSKRGAVLFFLVSRQW